MSEEIGAQPEQLQPSDIDLNDIAMAAHAAGEAIDVEHIAPIDDTEEARRAQVAEELADVEKQLEEEEPIEVPATVFKCKKGKHSQMGDGGLHVTNKVSGLKFKVPPVCLVCLYSSFARMFPTFDTGEEWKP